MPNNIAPIKTEYKGVVFDSKSEAVFARTLHIAGLRYQYHPRSLISMEEMGGHDWDFLVWLDNEPPNNFVYVEYKPKMPTMTYINNLTEKVRSRPVESIVVWGSPWNGPPDKYFLPACSYVAYPIFSSFAKYGWGDFIPTADYGCNEPYSYRHEIGHMLGIKEWMAQEAREYRFDLIDNESLVDLSSYFTTSANPKTSCDGISLIVSGEEQHRVERLKKVIRCIGEFSPEIIKSIVALEDHKGDLTCFWAHGCRRVGNGKTTVEGAWESVGELACNVTHEFL